VREDVADGYVSIERAERDYGVVLRVVGIDLPEYEIDADATARTRASLRRQRLEWVATDPQAVAAMFRAGEIDTLDVIRRYAVILDWSTGELLPKSTEQYRASFRARTVDHWAPPP
jgi:N-methylhydantoinase B